MGAYGTPEHLPPDGQETNSKQQNTSRKLNVTQKIGLWVYVIAIAFLGFCMIVVLNGYGKYEILGYIFVFGFLTLSFLFFRNFEKNKKSLRFIFLSIIPLTLYFPHSAEFALLLIGGD